jgi:O-antigen/teichoic acid export membrane protein
MAALRINILSNYAGQIWMAAMAVVFLPLYIRILGMEAFGLVGLMLSFQSISQLFDFGIGGATNRELSRRAHDPSLAAGARDLVRSSEIVIWLLAAAVGMVIWGCSGLMADHWLHLDRMGRGEATHAIAIMGVTIALLWPSAFYANCLSGLERQPALNVINAVFATLRYAGVIPVLWAAPSLAAFLWWYALIGVLQSLATAIVVWHALPHGHRPARWSMIELRGSRRFAGGLFTIGLLAMGVSQLDRLSIASLRPLAELGYYTLAISIAAGLGRMVLPMFNAIYPRFSRLVARGEEATLRELYHLGSQYLAVVVAAVAAVLIVFAHDVLYLWTGNADLSGKVALPLAILVAGSAFNGLMNIPYALQLANAWTRLAMGLNAASLLLGVPFCLWAVPRFGISGAACVWLLANLASVVIGIPLMHRRLLRGEMAKWYLHDVLPPAVAASIVALTMASLLPPLPRSILGVAWLAFASLLTLAASALASRNARATASRWLASRMPL